MSAAPHARPTDGRPAIEIEGLNKWYGDFHVLKDIDLTVARGERIAQLVVAAFVQAAPVEVEGGFGAAISDIAVSR